MNIHDYPYNTIPESESGFFAGKLKIFFIVLVLLIAAGYFMFIAFQSSAVYYYTVTEYYELNDQKRDDVVRISGKLVGDSFSRLQGKTTAHFDLTDGNQTLTASYQGVLPDLFFNDHSEIILEGQSSSNGVFESQNVIVKCPSKYISSEDPEQPNLPLDQS